MTLIAEQGVVNVAEVVDRLTTLLLVAKVKIGALQQLAHRRYAAFFYFYFYFLNYFILCCVFIIIVNANTKKK